MIARADYQLPCGAWVLPRERDTAPCPDPYCRKCRDHTGEVLGFAQLDERGSIVIWMMGLVMMVLLLSGLCLDIWRAVAAERALATAVDAAAAAGANGIDEAAYRNSGTVQLDPARAESLASDSLSQQPEFPRMDGVSVSATTARVTVSGGMVVRLTLMRIFVRSDPHVTATADAQPRRGS